MRAFAGPSIQSTMPTEGMNELIEKHAEMAYAAAYRLTCNRADAADLVQEAFLRVLNKAGLYDKELDFGGWLRRVIFRLYLNRKRGESRRREVPLEASEAGAPEPLERLRDPAGSPEAIAENNELRAGLEAALSGLPADMRACVILVDVERRGYEEAADILDWPVGSVAGRLFRARRLLRASLAGYEGEKT